MKKTILIFVAILGITSCSQNDNNNGNNLTGDLTLKQKLIQWSPWTETQSTGTGSWIFKSDSLTSIDINGTETYKCTYGSSSFTAIFGINTDSSIALTTYTVVSITQQELILEAGGSTLNLYHQ